MMRIMWIEFRRSSLFYLAVPLVGIEVLGMYFGTDDWHDMWSTASLAAAWPLFVVAAVLAGSSALGATTRSLRGESVIANASIPRWRVEAVMMLPAVLLSMLVVVSGLVVAQLTAWPVAHEGAGWLRPGFPLIGWSLLLLAIGWGHLAGRMVASYWTPPAAALVVLAIAVTATRPDGLVFVPILAPMQMRIDPVAAALPPLAGVVTVVVGVAAVRSRTHAGDGPGVRLPFAAGGALLVLALMVSSSRSPLLVPRTDSPTPLCTTGRPQICVFPEAPSMVPVVQSMADRLAALPAGIVELPESIYQAGLDTHQPGGGFGIDGGPWFVADAISGLIASDLACMPPEASPESDKILANTEYFTVVGWLTSRIYGGPRPPEVHSTLDGIVDLDAIRDVIKEPDPVQQGWVHHHLALMRAACDGTADPS